MILFPVFNKWIFLQFDYFLQTKHRHLKKRVTEGQPKQKYLSCPTSRTLRFETVETVVNRVGHLTITMGVEIP